MTVWDSGLVEVRKGAVAEASRTSLLVLDIDGVLLDPAPSFYAAAKETAAWAASRALGHDRFAGITDDDIAAFKAVGGFNDDFDLACGCAWAIVARESLPSAPGIAVTALASEARGLDALIQQVSSQLTDDLRSRAEASCSPAVVRPRCAARYAGRLRCSEMYGIDPAHHPDLPDAGLWPTESLLCDPSLLTRVPAPLAFCTGRNRGEARLAEERCGISVRDELQVVDDGSCARKPAPDGLLRLAKTVVAGIGDSGRIAGPLIFVGDTIDDQRAALAYRASAEPGLPPIVFVRVVGEPATSVVVDDAAAAGADIVVPSLDALLRAAFPGVAS